MLTKCLQHFHVGLQVIKFSNSFINFFLKKPFWSKIYYQINYAIHLYANLIYDINKANYKWQHMLNPRTFWLIFSNSFFDFLTWSSLTYQQILVSKHFTIHFSSADVFPNMNYSFSFLNCPSYRDSCHCLSSTAFCSSWIRWAAFRRCSLSSSSCWIRNCSAVFFFRSYSTFCRFSSWEKFTIILKITNYVT